MIDFYHVDSMETINYEPIYRHLENARMIASAHSDWFDYERAKRYFEIRGLPYQNQPSKNAECVVTTQYHDNIELPEYRDALSVRLIYGLAEKDFTHSEKASRPFDAVLVPGPYSKSLVSQYTRAIVVGFPKYDDFFGGIYKRQALLKEFGLVADKPVLVYLPTWAEHSSLDRYWQAIAALTDRYNVILKPHTCTVRFERQRIERFRPLIENGGVMCIEEQMNLDKLFVVADVVLADGVSGVFWEAALVAGLPTVALNVEGSFSKVLLDEKVDEVGRVNNNPGQLLVDIEHALSNAEEYSEARAEYADKLISFRDGSSGERAAEAIVEFVERKNKTAKTSQITTGPDSIKKEDGFKRRKRNIVWLSFDGLRPDKLFCCGNHERPKLFLDELLSSGSLFSKVYSAAAGTHTAMHAVFTSMCPSSNGVKGWTPEAIRRIDPHVLSLTDFLKRAGYKTFRYCDLDGEQVVPKSGFDVWESSGYKTGKALGPTNGTLDCPKRDEFIRQYDQARGPKFAYLHMLLLHELNGKMGNYWPSEGYERNVVEVAHNFEQLLHKFDISKDDLLIISTDHGNCLDSYWVEEERQLGPRHAEYSNLTFCSFITKDLTPCHIDKLVRSIDIAPTILDIIGAGPIGAQGVSLLPLIFGEAYKPVLAFREKGACYDIPPSPDESNLWCVRTERWKYVTHKSRKDCEWLMDLENDPDYTNNLIGKGLEIEDILRKAVYETLIDNPKKPLEIYAENNLGFSRRDIEPVISVVMPVEHSTSHLKDAIESLLAQIGPYFELIVVDGEATEYTSREILGLYGNHPHVHYHCLKQRPLHELLNFGMQRARGSYIALALPEVIYEENFLYELKKKLDRNPEIGLAYSDYTVVDEVGKINSDGIVSNFNREGIGLRNFIGVCVLFRSSLLKKSGLFTNEEYLCWDMWKRMAKITDFGNVPQTLAKCYGIEERIVGGQAPSYQSPQLPRVSVVLPTYNHLEFLQAAIQSVLKQTYTDFELIIVNDGSTDGTREHLDNLRDSRIRVIHQENKRLPEALNTGFRAAGGELLTWISADNYCAPILLELLVGALDAYPDAGFAYSAYAWIDENDQITGIHKDQDISCHKLLAGNPGIASFMYRRTCHERVGWYNPELEGAEDWDMWLRILEQFQPVYIPDILYYYRLHRDSMTEKVRETVFRASQRTFQKAIKRRNNQIDIANLYPTLESCRELETAKFYAYFDLGTTLLRSRFTQVELACQALENALSISPGSLQVTSNLAVAYARSGQWEKAVPLLRQMMKKAESPKVLEVCHSIIEAYRTGKPNLLSKISLFTPDKKSIELFQLEQRQKRIFSLAHCNQDSSAKKTSENEFAALNRAREIDCQGEDSSEKSKGRIIEENKRKILLVVHSFPPDWYAGVENYTYGFAKILIAKGFDVSVFYPKSDPHIQLPILKEDSYNGIKIYKLLSKSFYNLAFHVENSKVEKLFGNLLDEQCFNLIHFQHIKGFPFSLLNIAKGKGIPVCLTLHDFWFICHKTHLYLDGTGELCTGPDSVDKCAKCALSNVQNTTDPRQTTFLHHMMAHRQEYVRKLLRKIDIVAAPSRYLKEKFISCRFGKDKVAICPLGIEPVAAGERKRTDGVTFGFLGAIHELKNTVFLAEAFKRIRGNTRLIFWGDGKPGEIAKLQSVIEGQSHIAYKGSYSPEQLPEILSGVDIVIVPSLVENYPLVVRESLSAGVPVIASNVGGIPEIVSHMKNGMLFEPNNKEELAQRIQEIVDNPSIIEQLKKGITHIKPIKEDVEEWIDRYSKLIGGRDKRAGCSIIIPVFNKLELTRECMESIYSNTKYANYEIIIVDNASNDGTKEYLRDISKSHNNIKVIINEENLGFARACNQGAAASNGDYLVFLNNDTQVQPGWLEEFVKVLESDSEAGAVGGKLLYPDGSVQHAGVVMLEIEGVNSLLPRHIFVQQPSDNNFVNVPMVFQAVTAACVAVRKSDFENVNGFDESYWNGSEDVDLCFKLMEMGKKIVYQPESVVTHYESKSGKERRKGIKQNNKLLRRRWANKIKPDIVISGNQLREGTSQVIQPYLKSGEFVSVSRSQYINALIPWVKKFFVDGNRLPVKKLTFAVKTCTPSREKKRWGDTYFANSLAKAFMKLGHNCEVHFRDEWNQPDSRIDVVIHIKGRFRYIPKPHNFNVLWIISHPELHTVEEINQFDVVFCASKLYLEDLKSRVKIPCFYLPQATDEDLFEPLNNRLPRDIDLLFVGTNYYAGKRRKIIQDVLDTGQKYNLCVVGKFWNGLLDKEYYKAEYVEHSELPQLYSRAKIVLNDHHETMKQFGFINNRTFDLAALKVFQISDYVKGIEELGIITYQAPEDLREKLDYFLQNEKERERIASVNNELCKNFTFINVARQIFDVVNKLSDEKSSRKIEDKRILPSEGKSADTLSAVSTGRPHPKVSIVVSCCNSEKFLPQCLDSIRNQTMNEWELFLLDDASTDSTRSIIEEYSRMDERIRPYYFQDNKGPYVRRNFAIERAGSDFIVIQDSDDIMCPTKLEILYNEITRDERLGIVGSFYHRFLEEFNGLEYAEKTELLFTHDEIMEQYRSRSECDFCWHGSAIIRKEMFEAIGLYDENPYGADSFWLAKAAEYAYHTGNVKLKNIPECLTLRRMHPASQMGLLPSFDPRGRRRRYWQYCKGKLKEMRQRIAALPHTDIKAELKNCKCSDFIEKYGHLFDQWESEPLDNNVLIKQVRKVVELFNNCRYVTCITRLSSLEAMKGDIAKRFRNYDLLRAMAYFAAGMKQQSLAHLNAEIQNHNDPAARQFISDYFENQLKANVQDWCLQNGKLYDLQMIDTESESVAQQTSHTVSDRHGVPKPLVSIIVSCYNSEKFLPECIDSIRNQTMNEWELFLLDDASTDGTRSVIEEYSRMDERIKPYYFQDNRGPYVRRNFAIERANSDFIVIHDADDIMWPAKLEILYREILSDERLAIVGAFYRSFIDEFRGLQYTDEHKLPLEHSEIVAKFSSWRHAMSHGSAIIRKELFEAIGLYDENPFGSDRFWFTKVAEYAKHCTDVKFKNVPQYLTLIRIHHNSQTQLLPTFDPRSRRIRYRQYCEQKLNRVRQRIAALPHTDIRTELKNCKCSDFVEKYGHLFAQWESEPLDNDVLTGWMGWAVVSFNTRQYVTCITVLNGVETAERNIAKRFRNYDLLRAMAYFAIDRKEQSLEYLNNEIQNHDNSAARQFISDYFEGPHFAKSSQNGNLENQSKTDVQDWCLANDKLYDLRMIDTGSEGAAQQKSSTVSDRHGVSEPLVSVILPAYNAEKYIAEAIESVLAQNYKNFEFIVVDDGSTDNTKNIVLSFKDDRIRYFYQENRGAYSARNMAVKNAKGDFIVPLDTDDMITPDFIAEHLKEFERHPDADLVYCDDYLIEQDGKPIRVIERLEYTDRKPLIRDLFRRGFPIVPFRTCIRRSVFDRIGLFDERFRTSMDYDMIRRFVLHGLKAHHLKAPLYVRRMTPDSLSRKASDERARAHFEVVRRFTESFSYDELFPDVAWDRIRPETRQLHAKCLAAVTCLAIGQTYVETNSPVCARTAFELACSELNDCLEADPENHRIRQLLQKSELLRARYDRTPQQALCQLK